MPFFYNYGVATVILRNRLRQDGYVAETDAVYDAQQAVRIVRARAKEWKIDPQKIGKNEASYNIAESEFEKALLKQGKAAA